MSIFFRILVEILKNTMNTILEIQTNLIALETQGVNKEQKEILNKIWKFTSDLIENSYETKIAHALDYIYRGARLINTTSSMVVSSMYGNPYRTTRRV